MSVRILVADDEDELQYLLLKVFSQEVQEQKLDFIFASDGQETLNILKSEPDIAIMLVDIYMPKIDGLTLLHKLQESDFISEPPITSIVVSAYDDMHNIRKAMNAMAFDFLPKPMSLDDLRITVSKAISHANQLEEAALKVRQAQETLQRTNEDLERLVKERTAELNAFARTAAHDLKAPLGNVIGYVEFIEEYFEQLRLDEVLEVLSKIKVSGLRGINIVDEILLLATLSKDNIEYNWFDMGQVVQQTLYDLEQQLQQYQATVDLPTTWPTVVGYAPWIGAVWTNYITNALKYGGEPPRLIFGYRHLDNNFVQFCLQDNGLGLLPEDQSKLFTEFTRIKDTASPGHGLGLATVRRIIEKLNGQVGVKSQVGQGSTFYFTLPSVK